VSTVRGSPDVNRAVEVVSVSTKDRRPRVKNVTVVEYAITVKTSVIAKCVEAVDSAITDGRRDFVKIAVVVEYAITGGKDDSALSVVGVDSVFTAESITTAPNANGSKGK
jgi:hypothetical protein